MDYKESYRQWLESSAVDEATKEELRAIDGDEKEIQERFYKDLEFGTGGLRGILGAGTNRMNVYTVKKATQGLAEFIKSKGEEAMARGVVISYDCRIQSDTFAAQAAATLAANGIRVQLSSRLRPVPELSFAVRHFGAEAGIMITASHNPPKYNGYKVYGDDGGQLPPEAADVVLGFIQQTDIFTGVKTMDLSEAISSGLVSVFGDEVDDAFLDQVIRQQVNPEAIQVVKKDFTMLYTPLHGSGNIPVRRILERIGVEHLELVPQQVEPDGNFPTVKSPNPEEKSAFDLAIALAQEKGIDLIVGTDPDSDRIGVVARDHQGQYQCLTGNMVGALLTNYILAGKSLEGTLPENGVVIKTVVTSHMTDAICASYGVEVMNVLTGFKFIGEKIKEFERTGEKTYLFGFEESYGYLCGTYARDKDAVGATMLVAEMAAWYQLRGMTLYDGILELYEKYGTYCDRLISIVLEGMDGVERMKAIMASLREHLPAQVAGHKVVAVSDFDSSTRTLMQTGEKQAIDLPRSNVLKFELEGDSWFAARPSGTEPKIKFYFGTRETSKELGEARLDALEAAVREMIG